MFPHVIYQYTAGFVRHKTNHILRSLPNTEVHIALKSQYNC